MNKFGSFLLSIVTIVVTATGANAQQAVSLGSRINAVLTETWSPLLLLVSFGSAFVGLLLIARSLMGVIAVNDGRGGALTYANPIMMGVAGSLLLYLPHAAGIGMMTFFGSIRGGDKLGAGGLDYDDSNPKSGDFLDIVGNVVVGREPENCIGHAQPGLCVIKNISEGLMPSLTQGLLIAVFLVGLIALAGFINELRTVGSGQPLQKGWAWRGVVAVLLMQTPILFNIFTKTLTGMDSSVIGNTGLNKSSNLLKYEGHEGSAAVVQQYAEMFMHGLSILAFFGLVAFVRGIFMLKTASDGTGQGTYGRAITFIISGILIANMKWSMCVFGMTVAGSAC